MNKFFKLLLPLTVIVATSFAFVTFFKAAGIVKPAVEAAATETKGAIPQGTLNAFGFYAGMPKNEFDAAVIAMQKSKGPILKWTSGLNPEETSVLALGLLFPVDRFAEVAKEVIARNPGTKLICAKDDYITCHAEDTNGNTLFLGEGVFKDKAGHIYGALAISSKNFDDKKDPHDFGNVDGTSKENESINCPKPTRPLNGKCVSDL